MHIPACQTTQLELISFDQALEEAQEPIPTMTPPAGSMCPIFILSTDTSLEPEGIAP